eukprot:13219649-Alexandrium_andersonii.AAC.1
MLRAQPASPPSMYCPRRAFDTIRRNVGWAGVHLVRAPMPEVHSLLPSGCRVAAEWLPSGCRVAAEWPPSGRR